MFRHWTLRSKFVLISVSSLLSVCGIMSWLYYHNAKENARQEFVARARSIVLTTESIREEMARKWKLGLFDEHQLSQWGRKGEMDKVLAAVPVVTAWQSAMAKAKEGGYEFRVPKMEPRNPKNQPDELEARALKKFEADVALNEYSEVDPARNAVRYFRPIRLTQECLACHGDPARSRELWGNNEGKDPTGGRMENWKAGEVHGAFEVVQSLDEADARAQTQVAKAAGIVLLCIAAAGVTLFLIVTRAITRPIGLAVRLLGEVADGNVAQDVPSSLCARHDEIGVLAKAIQSMTGGLRQTVHKLTGNAKTLASASTELSSTAAQLASGAQETTSQSTTVASAAEQLSANMNTMSTTAEQMSANVKAVASAIEQMNAAISEVAKNAEHASAVAGDAAKLGAASNSSFAELGAAAEEIGKVVEVIQDIAEQTNLLALNATIEAARAGDAGKGFAVVATEVKELAGQTAAATNDIRDRIGAIQGTTQRAVQAISQIGDVVKEVNGVSRTIASAVEEQTITTREISRNIAEAAMAVDTVASGVAQSAVATREISQGIAGVATAAHTTARGADSADDAGKSLLAMTEELQAIVSHFHVDDCRFHAGPIKMAHQKWRIVLAEMIAGRRTLETRELKDHTQCAFGKWYFGEGQKLLGDLPVFQAIDREHEQIHAMARRIVETYNRGDKQEAANMLSEFTPLTDKLCGMLDELERDAIRQPAMA